MLTLSYSKTATRPLNQTIRAGTAFSTDYDDADIAEIAFSSSDGTIIRTMDTKNPKFGTYTSFTLDQDGQVKHQ